MAEKKESVSPEIEAKPFSELVDENPEVLQKVTVEVAKSIKSLFSRTKSDKAKIREKLGWDEDKFNRVMMGLDDTLGIKDLKQVAEAFGYKVEAEITPVSSAEEAEITYEIIDGLSPKDEDVAVSAGEELLEDE